MGPCSGCIGQLNDGDEAGFRQAVDELHAQQLDQIRMLAEDGANIVVLQEGAGMGLTDQVEKLLSDAARDRERREHLHRPAHI